MCTVVPMLTRSMFSSCCWLVLRNDRNKLKFHQCGTAAAEALCELNGLFTFFVYCSFRAQEAGGILSSLLLTLKKGLVMKIISASVTIERQSLVSNSRKCWCLSSVCGPSLCACTERHALANLLPLPMLLFCTVIEVSLHDQLVIRA